MDGGHPVGAREGQQGVRSHVRAAGKVLEGDNRQTHKSICIIERYHSN